MMKKRLMSALMAASCAALALLPVGCGGGGGGGGGEVAGNTSFGSHVNVEKFLEGRSTVIIGMTSNGMERITIKCNPGSDVAEGIQFGTGQGTVEMKHFNFTVTYNASLMVESTDAGPVMRIDFGECTGISGVTDIDVLRDTLHVDGSAAVGTGGVGQTAETRLCGISAGLNFDAATNTTRGVLGGSTASDTALWYVDALNSTISGDAYNVTLWVRQCLEGTYVVNE